MNKVRTTRSLRPRFFVAGVCLTVVLWISLGVAPAFAGEASVPESGLPLPPSILPVIVLQGSDFDMGYQYYQQLNELFGPWTMQAMQRPAGFTDAEIVALKAYQWYVKEYTPELIDQFKGMAQAATDAAVPLSYTEVLANYVGTRAYPGTEPEGADDDLPPACSAWAAWGRTTAGGSLITGQGMDPPWGDFSTFVTVVAYPTDGNAYINVAPPWSLNSNPVMPGINNKGVSTGGNAGEATRAVDRGVGAYRLRAGLITHMLRFADTAVAAKDMWLSYQQTGGWNATISDVSGNAFVCETSGAFQQVRKPGDFGEGDFIYSRNNFFTDEGGAANLGDLPGKFYPHGGWAQNPPAGTDDPGGYADIQMASVRTNQTMYNMLKQYRGKVNLDFAKMLFRFRGKMPHDPWDTVEYRATKARAWETPGSLAESFVTIGMPASGATGVMYVCTGPAQRVGSPYEAGPADDLTLIAGTNTFYALPLAANPDTMLGETQATAKRDIAWAYQRLMWKNYGDAGFEGLNALFTKANIEYYEGANWASKASAATGNDKLLYQANAATCFTRADAHGQQISEALVRPPVRPRDLGLKRYKAISYGF